MPQSCTICNRSDRGDIEAAIISGASLRRVASQFSTSDATLRRHRDHCLKPAIQALQAESEVQENEESTLAVSNALSSMDWMEQETRGIYNEVRKMSDYRLALQSLAELRRQVELRAKLEGELDERSITITAVPEWRELRALLLEALGQHPQAKKAVMRALEAYDHERSA